MTDKQPATIADYIQAAPPEGRAHLQRLYELLKDVAPQATEAIKWGNPFFIEPRFLFAFAAHKAHLSFVPTKTVFESFSKELEQHQTTKGTLKIPYKKPLPEPLIRKMAESCWREVRAREDDAFW